MKKFILFMLIFSFLVFSCSSDKKKLLTDDGDNILTEDGENGDESSSDSDGSIGQDENSDGSSQNDDGNTGNDTTNDEGTGGSDLDFEECAEVGASAELKKLPADIVIVVDNSGSMTKEASLVQENMNDFSQQIMAASVDVRVVLISADASDSQGICIDAPLGSENACPGGDDTNLPTYLHVYQSVGSHSALEDIVDTYDEWKSMRREEALLHFIIVTDDESSWSKEVFNRELAKLQDPTVDSYILHSIVSAETKNAANLKSPPGPCAEYAADEGVIYKDISNETGGVIGDLCSQEFKPIFDKMAEGISSVGFECEWLIPEVPEGEIFNKKLVNVDFKDDNGEVHTIKYVDSAEACVSGEQAWFYDNYANPTKILLCEETCSWMRSQTKPSIEIKFGCKTIQ